MAKRTSTFWARPFTSVLSLLLLLLFAYANFLCAARGDDDKECEHEIASSRAAVPDGHSHAASETSHHQQDTDHPHDCSRDSCFCVTMNIVVMQRTVGRPNQSVTLRVFDFAIFQIPTVVPILAATAYEHGPPAIASPISLTTRVISPRGPPYVA